MENENAQVRMPATMVDKLKWLDELFADETLSATAKNVAWRLARHHNDVTGRCDPKQDTLAKGVGKKVRTVNEAVRVLKSAGWIDTIEHNERTCYVLNLARAEAEAGEEVRRNQRRGCAETGVGGTLKSAQGVRRNQRTGTGKGTTKETTNPTTELAEAASELVAMDPAVHQSTMPVMPVTTPPTPANDDDVLGVEVSGWKIPGDAIRRWRAAFKFIDLDVEIMTKAPWYVGEVPEERRLPIFQARLSKINEAARQTQIIRRESRADDVAAGVEKDAYGRTVPTAKAGWIEDPRAIPPGVNPRTYFGAAPGQAIVYRGKGIELTEHDLERLKIRCPDLDIRAAVPAFERDVGTVENDMVQNRLALAGYLDTRQVEATAKAA